MLESINHMFCEKFISEIVIRLMLCAVCLSKVEPTEIEWRFVIHFVILKDMLPGTYYHPLHNHKSESWIFFG